MRVSIIALLLLVPLVLPTPANAERPPYQKIVERACGRAYYTGVQRYLPRLFSDGDAANFAAELVDARALIALADDCTNVLPQCSGTDSDCQQAGISVNALLLLAEQYNTKALYGTNQPTAAASALENETLELLNMCQLPGIRDNYGIAPDARDTLKLVLHSLAGIHHIATDPVLDSHLTELQDCAQRVAPDVTF